MRRRMLTLAIVSGISLGLLQAGGDTKSTADHEKMAQYYARRAQEFRDRQAAEEKLVTQYSKASAGYTKVPNPYETAKRLASYYGREADKAASKAQQQEKLARASSPATELAAK